MVKKYKVVSYESKLCAETHILIIDIVDLVLNGKKNLHIPHMHLKCCQPLLFGF